MKHGWGPISGGARSATLFVVGMLSLGLFAASCRANPEPEDRPWDAFWGPAPDAETRAAIFDELYFDYRTHYAAFVAAEADWDALPDTVGPLVKNAETYGEFYRQLSHIFLDFHEGHSLFRSEKVCSTSIGERPPVFFGGLSLHNVYGVCLTALDDDTALVYRVDPTNPAGLAPGDVIVGYDGLTLPQIRDDALRLPYCSYQSGHPQAHAHSLITGAAYSAHLYDEMDVIRAGTTTVESIATESLLPAPGAPPAYSSLLCNDQIPIAIPQPWSTPADYTAGKPAFTWGVLPNSNIGYIYGYGWTADAGDGFFQAVQDLWNTDGLIIDFRLNFGGNLFLSFPTLAELFQTDIVDWFHTATRASLDLYELNVETAPYNVTANPATYYDHPIALLTGPGAGSSGDDVAYLMAAHPRMRRFGRATNGSPCLRTAEADLWVPADPYIGDLFARRTTCTGLDSNLEPFAGPAIVPEEDVWLTPEDVAAGTDTVVEAALQWINAENGT